MMITKQQVADTLSILKKFHIETIQNYFNNSGVSAQELEQAKLALQVYEDYQNQFIIRFF